MAYATYAEFKAAINLKDAGAVLQTNIERILEATSDGIDRVCNRPEGFVADVVASARLYKGSGRPYQLIDECTEVTLVAVKESITDSTYTAWTVDDWMEATGDQRDPDFNRTPYTLLICDPNGDYSVFTSGRYQRRQNVPTVQVTAKWGFATTVPTPIKEATLMEAARWYKRLQSSMGDTLASTELGTLIYAQKIDPDVAFILELGRFIHPAVGIH